MTKDVTVESTVMKVQKERVSREDLRGMAIGQSVEFIVPFNKIESARSACNQLKLQGMKFSYKTAKDLTSITITRIS